MNVKLEIEYGYMAFQLRIMCQFLSTLVLEGISKLYIQFSNIFMLHEFKSL